MSKAVEDVAGGSVDPTPSASSDVAARSWVKKLLSVPHAQLSDSQLIILNSFSQLDKVMELPAVTKYLTTQNSTTLDLDLQDPTLIQALYLCVEVLACTGGIECIPYFLPTKDAKGLQRFLYAAATALLDLQPRGESITNLDPKNAVSLMLASTVFLQNLAFFGLPSDDESIPKDIIDHVLSVAAELTLVTDTQPLLPKCNKYLKETLDSKMSVEVIIVYMKRSASSVLCTYIVNTSPHIEFENLEGLVAQDKGCVETLLETPESAPGSRLLGNYFPLFHQLKKSSLFFNSIILDGPNGDLLKVAFDPLFAESWETAGLYFKLLKQAMKSAQEEMPADYYVIGTISRHLLHSMLQGVSKNVCYSEIEEITRKMESAAASAKWAPPLWLLEIKTDTQIVNEDVLPFLKRLNPSPTHSFCVLTTPEFLNLHTPATVEAGLEKWKRTCDFCGVEAYGMLICSGVSLKFCSPTNISSFNFFLLL
jgi:hypothetical protein